MGNSNSLLESEIPELKTWTWPKVEEIIHKFNTKGHHYGLEIGDIQTFTGLNAKDSEKMMEVLSLAKSQSINGAVVITAIILVVEPQTVSVESRKRALFCLVDYNNLQRISVDELEVLFYCVGLSSACLLNRKSRTPRLPRLRELLQSAMIKLQKDSKTSSISLNEYMEWSVEIAGDASSLLDVYQYFMPSQQTLRQPESEPESIDQTKPEDVDDPTVDPETNFVPMKNNEGEELLFPSFTDSHTSLMRQALTPELFDKLKSSETSNGIKLMQCIHMGVDVPKSDIGLVAADHESYETFSELFNAVLSSYHNINLTELLLPQSLYNSNRDSSELDRMDTLDYNFILSSRIQASRNVKGYSYSPEIAQPLRLALESSLMSALDKMKGEFSGTYWRLDSLPQDDAEFLRSNNLLLFAPSSGSAYDVAGVGRDWPNGRGVFSNKSTEFAVWVNGLDHISVISQNVGGDISSVFEDWITAMNGVERCLVAQGLEFDQDARLGYLTTCPGDVGSGFHASMVLKLENLTRQEEKLRSLCCQMSLNCEATADSSHWKITNQCTLGKSEVEITQHVIDSVAKIIAEEKELVL